MPDRGPILASGAGNSSSASTWSAFLPPHLAPRQTSFAHQATIPSGTYTATSSLAVTYSGPVTLNYAITTPGSQLYEGPDGTHGTDSTCDEATVGAGWPGMGSVNGTNGGGDTVFCGWTAATYSRTDLSITIQSEGVCSITLASGASVTFDPTTQVQASTLGVCDQFNNPDPNVPSHCWTDFDEYDAS